MKLRLFISVLVAVLIVIVLGFVRALQKLQHHRAQSDLHTELLRHL
jgi:hypothetical protein